MKFPIALVALALPAISNAVIPVNVPTPPPLVWQTCAANPARQCSTLMVPLNYEDPSQGYIGLPVARKLADTQSLGPLVVNFGGPVSEAAYAVENDTDQRLGDFFTPSVVQRYDIIGLTARAMNVGITCFTPAQSQQYWQTNHFSRSNTQLSNLLNLEVAANQRCLLDEPQIARHMSSAESIRDMESLRLALGLNKISFYGLSYGTFFGNRYAALYPGRVKSMVLDAVVDHSINDPEIVNDLGRANEAGWTAFKAWCANTANSCRLRGQNIDALFNQILATARATPIPAPRNPMQPGSPVTDWEFTLGLQSALVYGILNNWIEEILYQAANLNDASLVGYLYDIKMIGGDGTYTTSGLFRAITCVDSRWSQLLTSPSAAQAFMLSAKQVAPRFGEVNFVQSPQQCYGYPVAPAEPPPLNLNVASGIGPVLVIGGTLDQTTPYRWAQSVASHIPGSRLVSRVGPGHISIDKSRCVQEIVKNYLVNNVAPANGTQCSTDPDLWSDGLIGVPL